MDKIPRNLSLIHYTFESVVERVFEKKCYSYAKDRWVLQMCKHMRIKRIMMNEEGSFALSKYPVNWMLIREIIRCIES